MGKPHLRDKAKEQFWRDRIAAYAGSGGSVKAFCQREGLSEHCFYSWRRELKARDQEARTEKRAASARQSNEKEQNPFIPVRLVDSSEANKNSIEDAIEVVAPNGFRVLVPDNASAKSLAVILAAVQKIC